MAAVSRKTVLLLLFALTVISYYHHFMIVNIRTTRFEVDGNGNKRRLHSLFNPVQPSTSPSRKSVIITWFLTSKKDPQRDVYMPRTIQYMRKFYDTVVFHNLSAIIFYDELSKDFTRTYTTPNIKFRKMDSYKDFSITDFRFIPAFYFLKMNEFDYILLVDISDTFFWHDPFVYMQSNTQHSLFLSADKGTLGSNWWMVNKMKLCYGIDTSHDKTPVINDGVWGGKRHVILCLLECIVNQIFHTGIPNKSCDMAAMNWCIKFGNCAPEHEVNYLTRFANHPFRQNCNDTNFIIIHDKCADSTRKCISIQDKKLVRINCRTI